MVEKRSNRAVFAQSDLFGAGVNESDSRVGGRQRQARIPAGGGRYPKICGFPNFSTENDPPPDPRFSELEKIGLPGAWLRLARRVGFDAFLDVWRMVCEDETTRHDGGRRMPKLREFDTYLRFQRNRYIDSLRPANLDPKKVQALLRQNLGEHLSIEQVQRLMGKRKIPPS